MLLRRIIASVLFFLSFLSFLVFFLINGIKIDSFSFSGISISKLYIKYDKKFIVQIGEIILPKSGDDTETSLDDIKSMINKAPSYLKYFSNIDIYNFQTQNNSFNIKFDNDFIYVDNKNLNFSSHYSKEGNVFNLKIYSIYLKDIDLLLIGSMKLDFQKNITNFFGKYIYKDLVSGELNLQADKYHLDFFTNSTEMKDIKFLKNYFRTDEIGEEWMYENVTGKWHLDYLYGKVDLETFTPILNSIKGYARVTDAKVKFHPNVPAVETPLLNVEYEKDNLLIKMKEPTFKGISLDGSFVHIHDMTSLKYGHVDVNIFANHLLDENVLDILDAYDINLPLKQIKGKTNAHLHMYIPYDAPMKTYGNFEAQDALFSINGFEFESSKGSVDLIGSNVIISNTEFKHENMIDAIVNLNIDTKTLTSKGEALIKNFNIRSEKKEILSLKDYKAPIELNFKDKTALILSSLNTNINFLKEQTQIKVNDLGLIYEYSPLLKDLNIKKGNIELYLKENNDINFNAKLKELKFPIERDEKRVDELNLFGEVRKNSTSLYTQSNDLKIDINKEVNLILNGYDVNLMDNGDKSFDDIINVRLVNSNIKLPSKNIYSVDSNIKLDKNDIFIDGEFGKIDLPFSKDGKKLETFNVKGSIKDNLIALKSKDGTIDLKIENESNISIKIKNIDMLYNTNEESKSKYNNLSIEAKNSKIIINDKYEAYANSFILKDDKNGSKFSLKNGLGNIYYRKANDGAIVLDATKIDSDFINKFFKKEIAKSGFITLNSSGKIDFISGKVEIDGMRIIDLAILNNLITLVNTTPALINPLLAVPAIFGMVTNGGFNLNGYTVSSGYVDFTYDFEKQYLNLLKIHTVGNSVDFDGYGSIDFEKDSINSSLELIFMKDYSKIVGSIPGLSYIFLGDDKRVSTTVNITGNLENPKIESNVAKDSAIAPLNILKRIITSPFKLFETNDKEENQLNE